MIWAWILIWCTQKRKQPKNPCTFSSDWICKFNIVRSNQPQNFDYLNQSMKISESKVVDHSAYKLSGIELNTSEIESGDLI